MSSNTEGSGEQVAWNDEEASSDDELLPTICTTAGDPDDSSEDENATATPMNTVLTRPRVLGEECSVPPATYFEGAGGRPGSFMDRPQAQVVRVAETGSISPPTGATNTANIQNGNVAAAPKGTYVQWPSAAASQGVEFATDEGRDWRTAKGETDNWRLPIGKVRSRCRRRDIACPFQGISPDARLDLFSVVCYGVCGRESRRGPTGLDLHRGVFLTRAW